MEEHQSPGTIRVATAADVKWLDRLQHIHTEAVGFLVRQALETYATRGNVLVAEENDAPAGYILHRPALKWRPEMATIVQAAVEMDAQRRRHGLALLARIETAARQRGQLAIQANCAVGLAANEFWKAAGFYPIVYMTPPNRRAREVICWRKPLTRRIPIWFILPPPRTGRGNTPTRSERDPGKYRLPETVARQHISAAPGTSSKTKETPATQGAQASERME